MKTLASRLLNTCAGATAIEYALIAAFVALAIVAPLTAIGPMITNPLGVVSAQLK